MRDYANEDHIAETNATGTKPKTDTIQPEAAFLVGALANLFSMKIVDRAALATKIALTLFTYGVLILSVWALVL